MNRPTETCLTHPGHWPLWPRMLLLLLTGLCCAGASLVLHAQPRSIERVAHANRLQQLKLAFQVAASRSAVLPALQARSAQLGARLASAKGPSGPDAADSALQARLARCAAQNGLSLDSLRPLPGDTAGAELTISGDYAALMHFVAELSQVPHPLLFESLDISVRHQGDRPGLLMKTTVRPRPAFHAAKKEHP